MDHPTTLSIEEIEHFALQGYVVKNGVLDPDLMAKAIDLMWSKMPPHLDRGDPSSWRGKLTDCTGTHGLSARDGRFKIREDLWGNDVIDRLITRNADIIRMIEQLLAEDTVEPPERFRGFYPIFPTPEHAGIIPHPHVDFDGSNAPFKVGVAAYLDDVPSKGGGFMVWPESHRTLFYDCATEASSTANSERPAFRKHFTELQRGVPLEITGSAGDVVIYHYCLIHAPSINLVPGHVRQAIFCNYRTKRCRNDAPRSETIWGGWEGIARLNSIKIRESIDPPRSPRKVRRNRISLASIRRHLLRTPLRIGNLLARHRSH